MKVLMAMASTIAGLGMVVALLMAGCAEAAPARPDYASCVPYILPSFIPHSQVGSVRNCCLSALMEGPVVYKEWRQYLVENPLPQQPRVRRAAHLVAANSTYLQQLDRAFQLAKDLPKEDPRSNFNMDNYHCMQGGAVLRQKGFPDQVFSVHQNWHFHPFHRWFTFFYERTLAKLVGDDTFALPFWNWENQAVTEPHLPNVLPWYFRRPDLFPALFSANRNPRLAPGQPEFMIQFPTDWDWDVFNGARDTGEALDEDLLRTTNNANLHKWIAQAPLDKFMSNPLRAGDLYIDGIPNFENLIHSVIHFTVGDPERDYEDMGALYSSMHDSLLMVHHANVDRIWALWQTLGLPNYESDPDFLDQEFFFYNEHGELVRVTTADCLDIAALGYTYQKVEDTWLHSPAVDGAGLLELPSDSVSGSSSSARRRSRRHTW